MEFFLKILYFRSSQGRIKQSQPHLAFWNPWVNSPFMATKSFSHDSFSGRYAAKRPPRICEC